MPTPARIAIVGGGWAGMAAAVSLQQQGLQPTVWEASRHWGGRARALRIPAPQDADSDYSNDHWTADNGQHILIGAYQVCLQLMRTVGIAPQALLRLPLDLRHADGQGLRLPDCAPPWDAAWGIARAKGWSWAEKLALLRTARRWQRQQFQCPAQATVADLCQGLPARLMQDFVEPLCISALNLPATTASGSIFLRVLQDSLFSGKGGSNLLIPCTDLSTLFPGTAAAWLAQRGAALHLGTRVQRIAHTADAAAPWLVDGQAFDAVLLATPCAQAARLVQQLVDVPQPWADSAAQWAACAQALPHTAIATVYAYTRMHNASGHSLHAPMAALRSHAEAPAQFAFDKGQLHGPAGLIALVVSACHGDKDTLQRQVLAQARAQLRLPDLQPLKTVIDRRATFACTPGVQRPASAILPGLWACGDYVQGPYPATLEGAARSGMQTAQAVTHNLRR